MWPTWSAKVLLHGSNSRRVTWSSPTLYKSLIYGLPTSQHPLCLRRELIATQVQDGYVMVTAGNEAMLGFARSWVAGLRCDLTEIRVVLGFAWCWAAVEGAVISESM